MRQWITRRHTLSTHPQVGRGVVEPVELGVHRCEGVLVYFFSSLTRVDEGVRQTDHRCGLHRVQLVDRHHPPLRVWRWNCRLPDDHGLHTCTEPSPTVRFPWVGWWFALLRSDQQECDTYVVASYFKLATTAWLRLMVRGSPARPPPI